MARPQKIGLDYFPMDCKPDKKVNSVIRKFGAEGFGVLISIFQNIYFEGYYMDWNDEISEDFSLELDVEQCVVNEIVLFCVKREIFNSDMFNTSKILTSNGIQKRFIEATKRRTSNNNVDKYRINELESTQAAELMYTETPLNGINDNKSTQSKVKDSKEDNNSTDKSVEPDSLNFSEWDMETAETYLNLSIQNNPNSASLKKANLNKWAKTVRDLREIDKYPKDLIIDVFRFGLSDDFWKINAVSVASIRTKGKNNLPKFENILSSGVQKNIIKAEKYEYMQYDKE